MVYCVVDGGPNLESKVGPLYTQATTTLCMKAGEMLDLTKKDIILQFSIRSVLIEKTVTHRSPEQHLPEF